jgi:hypothetical protein
MALTPEQQALDYNPELQDVSRQRKLADLLMAQGMQQPQGQMISGYYVAPSWSQQINPLANILAGQAIGERADTQQSKLAEALRGKQAEVMQAYAQAKTPQEKFAIGTSQYAPPQLKAAMFDKLKSQKVGESESILDYDLSIGGYNPIATGGMKAAPEIKQAMQMLGINKPLDQLSPQELQAVNATIVKLNQSKGTNISVNTGQHGFDNALKLRSDFRAEPVYKGFEETKAAKNQIDQAAKMASPAGDLAAATKIMKILDPGSVVRESELGMAMAATGVEDKVKNYAQMVIDGTKLTPNQRKDFVDLSNKLYNASAEQFNQKRGEYAGIAERNKLDVEAAVGAPAEMKKGKLRWNPMTGVFE